MERFFSEIEKKCFDAADKLPLGDTKGRDRAYTLVHLSRKLKGQIEYYAENGRFWQDQLDELLKPTPKQEGNLYG